MRRAGSLAILILLVTLLTLLSLAQAADSTTSPDTAGRVGDFTSLELDAAGNPVVSYLDGTFGNLKLIHCDDPLCAGDESANTSSPDTAGVVGFFTSLELDAAGNPVISYIDQSNFNLKVLHCDDPLCAGDESANTRSPGLEVGVVEYSSLELDAAGYPVVSYRTSGDLKLLHCDDPLCDGDESANTTSPDTDGNVGEYPSLELDAAGHPVVGYYDGFNGNLKVLHCDDPLCAGDESANTTSPDTDGDVGKFTSLELDAAGNPVVSYYDQTNGNLKLLHCDDPLCAGDESANSSSPDTDGSVGLYTSLELDAAGKPVVSYNHGTNADLKLLHCDDPLCGGDESTHVSSPDTAGVVGAHTSLKLDAAGNPVVSYLDGTNGNLKLLHCDNSRCDSDIDDDGVANNNDPDDDGDGQSDIHEAVCGSESEDSASLSPDADGDGIPNCIEDDADDDGQPDSIEEACGTDPEDANSVPPDSDGDGTPDCLEDDSDNDGQADTIEELCGSDPADPSSLSPDADGDGVPDCIDPEDNRPKCNGQPATIYGVTSTNGTAADDVIVGTSGPDSLRGGPGDDTICGRGDDDRVKGSGGDDTLFGNGGSDTVIGDAGNDTLRGKTGDDTLRGKADGDAHFGGRGADVCKGGAGVDSGNSCETATGIP